MPVDYLGNMEITCLSATLPKDINLTHKELYSRLSLDGTDWRKTLVRRTDNVPETHTSPRRTYPLETSPIVLPVTSEHHHIHVEIWTYKRSEDKDELIAKGKHSFKDAVANERTVEFDVDLHHHLHLSRGSARVRLKFIKQIPGPPIVPTPHGVYQDGIVGSPPDRQDKAKFVHKLKDIVRRGSKVEKSDLDVAPASP
ncbi:hypothetical protein SpCBS45565_g07550 [Spizellomyces sp. 'palustris']|nr:hypothetical protein SpCBS45565_g07550 [Spizellomyces sp. 'palustris']